jgi:hypothetical protein
LATGGEIGGILIGGIGLPPSTLALHPAPRAALNAARQTKTGFERYRIFILAPLQKKRRFRRYP